MRAAFADSMHGLPRSGEMAVAPTMWFDNTGEK